MMKLTKEQEDYMLEEGRERDYAEEIKYCECGNVLKEDEEVCEDCR